MQFFPHRALRRSILLVLAAGTLLGTAPVLSADPQEIPVSDPSVKLNDPEFNQALAQITWVDGDGNLWQGNIDPATGDFVPPTGQAFLVDTGAVTVSTIGNGPTWSIGSNGSFITYTKYDAQNRFTLASAQFNGSRWVPALLPNGTNAYGPIGGEDISSPATISYLAPGSSGSQIVLWREVGSSTEKQIPKAVPPGVQWIKGERAVTYNATAANGKAQVFKYSLDTNLTAQITSESGGTLSAQMWEAPEYNNALLALTLINGKTQIGIYQKVGTKWQQVNVLKPPSVGTYLWSVEPFTYNGKSYLYMVTSTSSNQKSLTVPTEVWIAGVDPAAPFYRKVCNSQQEVRKNPKAFITTQGAYIYFEVISLLAGTYQIYRVDSGLGPPAN